MSTEKGKSSFHPAPCTREVLYAHLEWQTFGPTVPPIDGKYERSYMMGPFRPALSLYSFADK